jgi:hypothetical protein
MRRRDFGRAALLLGALGLAACASPRGGSKSRYVRHYEDLIRRELPIGSSVEETIAFLEEQGTLHSTALTFDRTLYGTAQNVKDGFMTRTDIRMLFYFDKRKRLQDYRVEEIVAVF